MESYMDETLPFEEYLKQNFAEEGFLVVEEPPPVTLIVSKVEKEVVSSVNVIKKL